MLKAASDTPFPQLHTLRLSNDSLEENYRRQDGLILTDWLSTFEHAGVLQTFLLEFHYAVSLVQMRLGSAVARDGLSKVQSVKHFTFQAHQMTHGDGSGLENADTKNIVSMFHSLLGRHHDRPLNSLTRSANLAKHYSH